MRDETDIVKSLECCAHLSGDWCEKCSYKNENESTSMTVCMAVLANDAYMLLKKKQNANKEGETNDVR